MTAIDKKTITNPMMAVRMNAHLMVRTNQNWALTEGRIGTEMAGAEARKRGCPQLGHAYTSLETS